MIRQYKVCEIFGRNKLLANREVGIEIEMEGSRLHFDQLNYWRQENDPSLRGTSMEYVLRQPVKRDKVEMVLNYLKRKWEQKGSDIKPSDNCGIHIHIDCNDLTLDELLNFMVLYLVFEDLLVRWCGETREGNFYCLRAKDAEGLIDALIRLKQNWKLPNLMDNAYRYSSMNIVALQKFGSLEFRAMQTPNDIMEIQTWVNLLLKVKDKSKGFRYPHEILEGFSANGVRGFVHVIFDDLAGELDFPDAKGDVLQSIRMMQDVAYAPQECRPPMVDDNDIFKKIPPIKKDFLHQDFHEGGRLREIVDDILEEEI